MKRLLKKWASANGKGMARLQRRTEEEKQLRVQHLQRLRKERKQISRLFHANRIEEAQRLCALKNQRWAPRT